MINNAAIFPGQGNLSLEKFRKLIGENLEAQRILNKAMNTIGKKSEDFFKVIFKTVHINSQILTFYRRIYFSRYLKEMFKMNSICIQDIV